MSFICITPRSITRLFFCGISDSLVLIPSKTEAAFKLPLTSAPSLGLSLLGLTHENLRRRHHFIGRWLVKAILGSCSRS